MNDANYFEIKKNIWNFQTTAFSVPMLYFQAEVDACQSIVAVDTMK